MDQLSLDNYEQLAMVFQSSVTDYDAGASKTKLKINPMRHTYHEKAYLRVYSPSFIDRIVLFIDEQGNKSFLKELKHDPKTIYILRGISFEEILSMITEEEQDNLVYFLDHA